MILINLHLVLHRWDGIYNKLLYNFVTILLLSIAEFSTSKPFLFFVTADDFFLTKVGLVCIVKGTLNITDITFNFRQRYANIYILSLNLSQCNGISRVSNSYGPLSRLDFLGHGLNNLTLLTL
jgi:hypothetical protein